MRPIIPDAEMSLPEDVEHKLASLPARPGCYVFRDSQGEALYIGKATSLRSRVRSYFQAGSSDDRGFLPLLRRKVADFETVVTASEKEAAILENNLIKKNRPRYNVKLRDDKEFLTLRLSAQHDFPRLELVRRPATDGARYFGPYHSATAARRTLHLVEKHFQLRTCSDRELSSRKRPCLQYQIKRCPAPCVYEVDREHYAAQVHAVALFLQSRHDELSAELTTRMNAAAEAMEYELAAMYRDQLQAVRTAREAQRIVSVSDRDQDVLGLYREGDLVELSLLTVRGGRVVDAASISHKRVELPDDELVATFLREHYGREDAPDDFIPDEIVVPVLPEGVSGVAEWLSERRQTADPKARRVDVSAPQRGNKRQLLTLAQDNARHAFQEKRRAADDIEQRLAKLQEKLRLPVLPRRIECCDISHLGGQDTVGAIVALTDGAADKKRYRSYTVKSVTEGDDYAAMYEVLSRRFRRGRTAKDDGDAAERDGGDGAADAGAGDAGDRAPEGDRDGGDGAADAGAGDAGERAPEGDRDGGDGAADAGAGDAGERAPEGDRDGGDGDGTDWEFPDLFVVDGGRGQLAVALTAAHDLGLHDLAVVGLAKERETPLGEKLVDRVYLPGQKNPVSLRANSPELFLLTRARDEAHRFSNRGRKKAGKRRRFESELDQIRGIGAKTRKALLTHLGSLEGVRAASDEAILAVPGVTRRQLDALRKHFAANE
ncbi:MAG: excinuclease ABC subunit UvrC [Polyangiaceae bacterium]